MNLQVKVGLRVTTPEQMPDTIAAIMTCRCFSATPHDRWPMTTVSRSESQKKVAGAHICIFKPIGFLFVLSTTRNFCFLDSKSIRRFSSFGGAGSRRQLVKRNEIRRYGDGAAALADNFCFWASRCFCCGCRQQRRPTAASSCVAAAMVAAAKF